LQQRLRSLDPYFTITKFGGNANIGYVCGEFDPESMGGAEPQFPAQVENTNLGSITVNGRAATIVQYSRNRRAATTTTTTFYVPYTGYDGGKCAWTPARDPKIQRRGYEIRFNKETVRAYQSPAGSGAR